MTRRSLMHVPNRHPLEGGTMFIVAILLTGAYLIGSIPFTFLYGKLYGHDIRKEGSGNVGGTNLVRVIGPKGIPGVLLDISKGSVAVILARYVLVNVLQAPVITAILFAVILCAMLGHMFPVFLNFKGGKGVAVTGGGVLALAPGWGVLVYAVSFLGVAVISDMMSVASVLAATVLPVYVWFALGRDLWTTGLALVVGSLIVWAHRGNLVRIYAGTEKRVGAVARLVMWVGRTIFPRCTARDDQEIDC